MSQIERPRRWGNSDQGHTGAISDYSTARAFLGTVYRRDIVNDAQRRMKDARRRQDLACGREARWAAQGYYLAAALEYYQLKLAQAVMEGRAAL